MGIRKMKNFLSGFFRRKALPKPFDIEKAVGHYLLTLPRCTNRVLVVSRRNLDKRYNYEMTVDTASLAVWAEKHDKGAWSSYEPEQAARKALPLWLRLADLSDNSVSFPPKMFSQVLRGYHETFLAMKGTQVYCHQCHQIIEQPIVKYTQLPPREIFDYWRYEWHCPNGHLLYFDEVGRHGVFAKPPLTNYFDEDTLSIPTFLRKQSD